MEKLKTAKEVADWLGTDVQRIYQITREGLLPHILIGQRQYRYNETAIQRWIDEGGNQKECDETATNQ